MLEMDQLHLTASFDLNAGQSARELHHPTLSSPIKTDARVLQLREKLFTSLSSPFLYKYIILNVILDK